MKKIILALCVVILSISFLGLQTPSERDKVQAAMEDLVTIATGLADHIIDNGECLPNAGPIRKDGVLYKAIVPFYVINLPVKDPWGHDYLVYTREAINGQYGITGMMPDDFLVVSLGKDGVKEDWIFNPSNPKKGTSLDFNPDSDLIMLNGSWIRCPIK